MLAARALARVAPARACLLPTKLGAFIAPTRACLLPTKLGALPVCVASALVARECVDAPAARAEAARQLAVPASAAAAMRARAPPPRRRDTLPPPDARRRRLETTLRLLRRSCELGLYVAPLALSRVAVEACKLVGIAGAEERWWDYALWSVEGMGPTAVKLCQWAAGRPDLFPAAATKRFSRLHDAVRPHAFHHTDRALAAALGADWRDTLELDERRLLGSGCIAQVYEGTHDGQRVAVKVVHPGVREAVETDMALLAFCVGCGERFAPDAFRYLAVGGSVHRFGAIMRSQLDLRTEASNLERLHAHFVRDDSVVVPRPVGRRRSPDVLVEEFVAGVPVLDFARGDEARAAKIAEAGARAVLKMVLHHNFVHGDLHPGNMLVNDRAQLVLLDAGICVEIGDRAHEDMVSILKAMLEARGADAGRLILGSHANRGDFGAMDRESEARFVTGIDEMVARSRDQPIFESMAEYMSTICGLAVSHRVVLDASFVSVALAIKIMEGLCLGISPDFPFLEIAAPMFLQAQMTRSSQRELGRLSAWSRGVLEDIKAKEGLGA